MARPQRKPERLERGYVENGEYHHRCRQSQAIPAPTGLGPGLEQVVGACPGIFTSIVGKRWGATILLRRHRHTDRVAAA